VEMKYLSLQKLTALAFRLLKTYSVRRIVFFRPFVWTSGC